MVKQWLDSINLNYEMVGDGEPLLFIHGLGSSLRDWEKQVEFFCIEYKVICFDLRGHGRSDKPEGPYSIALFVSDCVELIKALEIMPVHLIGISLGGMIALELAASVPELVRSLVVVNSPSEVIVRTLKERLVMWQRFFIARFLGMRQMGKFLGDRLFPDPEQSELRRIFIDRWSENEPGPYREAMQAIVGWSVTERLCRIECPTLIVAAEHDYTPLADKVLLTRRIERAELVVIENSRHGTPVDHPEEFNNAVADFLHRI